MHHVRRLLLSVAVLVALCAAMPVVYRLGTYTVRSSPPAHQLHPSAAFGLIGLFMGAVACLILAIQALVGVLGTARRSTGLLTRGERATLDREAAERAAYQAGWQQARAVAAGLAEGRFPQPLVRYGVVLKPGEQAYLDLDADYARYYGGDGTYQHISGVFWGSPAFVTAGLAANAIDNRIRRSNAQAEAVKRWRERQRVRVIATDRRLICQVGPEWLSFYFSGASACYPEPQAHSLVLDFPDTSPLLLGGPNAAVLAVLSAVLVHGPQAVHDHPALAPLRG
jgi:hypothetical protein